MSEADDAIIKAVARELQLGHETWDDYARAAIRAYLKALEEMGWARPIPKVWTDDMWQAWKHAHGGIEDQIDKVVAASPKPPGAQQ